MRPNTIKQQSGYSSIIAVVLLLVFGMSGTTLVDMSSIDARIKSQEMQTAQALQVGNGGIQYALEKIKSGLNPNNTTKTLGKGEFQIFTNPQMSQVSVKSTVGEAKTEQVIETPFAKACLNIDTSQTDTTNNILRKINLKKTCHDAVIITSLAMSWSSGSLDPITDIQMNGAVLYGPSGTGTDGEIINILDYTINNAGLNQLDYVFSQAIPLPNTFTLTLFFKDGSETNRVISLLP